MRISEERNFRFAFTQNCQEAHRGSIIHERFVLDRGDVRCSLEAFVAATASCKDCSLKERCFCSRKVLGRFSTALDLVLTAAILGLRVYWMLGFCLTPVSVVLLEILGITHEKMEGLGWVKKMLV